MTNENTYSQYTVGTAGHVDHGKSSLVKALTGYDPDVLKEEKERGLTVELGFTYLDLGEGVGAGIIDVPGHEKFLRMAVAGVTGIDVVLLVVAADEGIMPQTREHIAILGYLGCSRGIIVLTKSDLVDEEWMELVTEDVAEYVEGTFIENAPIVPISSVTGYGLDELKATIRELLSDVPQKTTDGPFRMPIDRVFTLRGFGTVIAGTVESGTTEIKTELEIQPSGSRVRVRGIQSQHIDVEHIGAGGRAALNITGIDANEINRGYEIAGINLLVPTSRLDVRLNIQKGHTIKHRQTVRFHKGTAEVFARVLILESDRLEGGSSGLCQLELREPVVATRYEPFILRHHSELRLLGGGIVLDLFPTRHRRKDWVLEQINGIENARDDSGKLLAALFRRKRGPKITYRIDEIAREMCLSEKQAQIAADKAVQNGYLRKAGPEYIIPDDYDAIIENTLKHVAEIMKADQLKESVGRDEIRGALKLDISPQAIVKILSAMVERGELETVAAGYRIPGSSSSLNDKQQNAIDRILAEVGSKTIYDISELKSSLGELPDFDNMFKYCIARDIIVNLGEGVVAHPDNVEIEKQRITEYLTENETVRPSDYKNLLGVSRKQVTALLDYFYDIGVTVREKGTHRLKV